MNANISVMFNSLSLSFKFYVNHFCEGCKEKSHMINKTFYAKNPFTKYRIDHSYDVIMIDIMHFFILFMKNFYFINCNNFCNTLYIKLNILNSNTSGMIKLQFIELYISYFLLECNISSDTDYLLFIIILNSLLPIIPF